MANELVDIESSHGDFQISARHWQASQSGWIAKLLRGGQVGAVNGRLCADHIGLELVALHPRLHQFNFANVSHSQPFRVDVHDSVQLGQALVFGLELRTYSRRTG
jgi:hypothetical protein